MHSHVTIDLTNLAHALYITAYEPLMLTVAHSMHLHVTLGFTNLGHALGCLL